MTIDELLTEAAQAGKWKINTVGQIRCEKGDCPILAVAKSRQLVPRTSSNQEWEKCAGLLGLTPWDARVILSGADRPALLGGHQRSRVRKVLCPTKAPTL